MSSSGGFVCFRRTRAATGADKLLGERDDTNIFLACARLPNSLCRAPRPRDARRTDDHESRLHFQRASPSPEDPVL